MDTEQTLIEEPLNIADLVAVLDKDGPLSKLDKLYEVRPSQLQLLEFVAMAFNQNHIALAEAGTGVGKSFAYLIPSLAWATQNHKRIVISTATLALQEQLFKKDVPRVKKLLKTDVIVMVAKGRQNYLCLLRLEEMLTEEALFLKDDDPLFKIEEWSKLTKTGDKADLTFAPDRKLWSDLISDSDTCHGVRCKHYEQCFIYKMRKQAANAHIIIVNHHLLFADLSLREESGDADLSILPNYDKIIFDEAHHIESSAVSFFSETLTVNMIYRLLLRFYRRKRGQNSGVLAVLEELLPKNYRKKIDEAHRNLEEIKEKADRLNRLSSSLEEGQFRLTTPLERAIAKAVTEPMTDLKSALLQFSTLTLSLIEALTDEETPSGFVYEAKAYLNRLKQWASLLEKWTQYGEHPHIVFWGEQQGEGGYYRYIATPLDIGPKMRTALYDKHESVVMLSATLAVGGSFDFFKRGLGLKGYTQRELEEAIFASPFLYNEQAILALPSDAPDPASQSAEHDRYTADFLLKLLQATQGRALVLFTSYRALETAFNLLEKNLKKQGILLLKQGDDDRNKLIKKFEQHGRAVLLGTDSFWEGVDIDNRALKSVVICRLPFSPPSAPLAQAKQEALEKEGGNAFLELQEPQMAIKLKQGFGRLIRRGSDYGLVFIIDRRILTKSYGKRLIESLPPALLKVENSESLIKRASHFIN